ncbi:MAG: hypothetical protein ABSA66_01630 [Roseiarcus sp.]
MQIHYDRSAGKPTTSDEGEDLLQCRMTILGLDSGAIERDFREAFDRIKRNCASCSVRAPCALDLKRDPTNLAWEAYCPNSGALNALVALTEAIH